MDILINGLISVAVSLLLLGLVALFDREVRQEILVLWGYAVKMGKIWREE